MRFVPRYYGYYCVILKYTLFFQASHQRTSLPVTLDSSSLGHGVCKIRVAAPTILDHHPWTVVTQVSGHEEELSQSTQHTLTMPPSMLDGNYNIISYDLVVYTNRYASFPQEWQKLPCTTCYYPDLFRFIPIHQSLHTGSSVSSTLDLF